MNPYEKVIVALDHEKVEDAYRLVDEIGDKIGFYKVGPVLYSRCGTEIIDFLHKKNKKIFLDLKLHDIPNVVAQTVTQIGELGVQFLTLHTLGGRKMLEMAASACRDSQLKLLGVTLLTSHSQTDSEEIGWNEDTSRTVARLLDVAVQSRLAGIICSPQEIKLVRANTMPGFQIVTPGIRLAHRTVYQDDQKRIATPNDAIEWGADYMVIGRPITSAREPKGVVDQLFN